MQNITWELRGRNAMGYRMYSAEIDGKEYNVACADKGTIIEGADEPLDHDETPDEVVESIGIENL